MTANLLTLNYSKTEFLLTQRMAKINYIPTHLLPTYHFHCTRSLGFQRSSYAVRSRHCEGSSVCVFVRLSVRPSVTRESRLRSSSYRNKFLVS